MWGIGLGLRRYEGLTTAQIRANRPGWTVWPDGCPGGETGNDVARRVDRVVRSLRDAVGDVAVFGHGHCLRLLTGPLRHRWSVDARVGAGAAGHPVVEPAGGHRRWQAVIVIGPGLTVAPWRGVVRVASR